MSRKRVNPNAYLTYTELCAILQTLDNNYRHELGELNADTLEPYKILRGKILGIKDLNYALEDHFLERQKEQNFE